MISFEKLLYVARNFQSRRLFVALKKYCRGSVLDVGGFNFFETVSRKNIAFDHWTVLEPSQKRLQSSSDKRIDFSVGNGCEMTQFPNNTFDTVINIQVLEHVFEPIKMFQEIARVLKPGGYAIYLIPQTVVLHEYPEHYYNFTKFWAEEAIRRGSLEKIELTPLGGFWETIATRLVHFFFQAARIKTFSDGQFKRNLAFYVLLPFMVLFAILAIPICLVFSMGDLTEEANNHLVIVRKVGSLP